MRRLVAVAPFVLVELAMFACKADYSVDTSPEGGAISCADGACSTPVAEAGPDSSLDGATSDGEVVDGSGGQHADGTPCTKPGDCKSTLCADSSVLGATTFTKTGSVCSTPCCTSEQCGTGLVCVGTGTGGHYCLPAAPLGRPLGTSGGGHTCTKPEDCRAGVCLDGVCADSCCADANCNASTCKPVDVEGDTHKSYACSPSGGPGSGQPCGPVDSCASGVCTKGICQPPCCGLATVDSNDVLCDAQALSNGDTFSFANGGTVGTAALGASCTTGTVCKTGYCDKADGASSGVCSDICCTDSDCAMPFICRPRTGLSHFLRCTMP